MTLSDPIADMLTRIRNGVSARHDVVTLPASKLKLAIAKILKEEGFVRDYEMLDDSPQGTIKVHLRYDDDRGPFVTGLKRVSKPGLRVYVQKAEIPRVLGGMGIAILSTPQGVMTGSEAWKKRVGGEVLCYVW